MIKITATVNERVLSDMAQELQDRLADVVAKAAFKIQLDAMAAAPVDTGALRSSIFTVTYAGSGRRSAMTSARAARAGISEASFTDKPSSPFEAFVVVGVQYGIFQELGARGRPGRFYLTQAGARNREWFMNEVQQVMRGLGS